MSNAIDNPDLYAASLADLKVGQLVCMKMANGDQQIIAVTRVTKKMIITTRGRYQRLGDNAGSRILHSGGHRTSIRPATPADVRTTN